MGLDYIKSVIMLNLVINLVNSPQCVDSESTLRVCLKLYGLTWNPGKEIRLEVCKPTT